MSNLPALKHRAFSSTGAVGNGYKLFFYASGGSTPIDTFSNATLVSANANPVVADSAGYFGEIYLSLNTAYRVVLKDASNNTIFDLDPIYADTLDGTTLPTHVYEMAEHPGHYGAAGNGSTNDTTDLQEAIDAATATRDGVVDLGGRTYRCDTTINLKSGLKLRNGRLNFANSASASHLKALGTRGSAVTLTANIARGDILINMTSTTGIVAGDVLYLYDSTSVERGELVVVSNVASATQVEVHGPIQHAYTTANSASVKEYTTLNDIVLENLVITTPTGTGTTFNVIHAEVVQRFAMRNVAINGMGGSSTSRGVQLRSALGTVIDGCHIRSVYSTGYAQIDVAEQSRDTSIVNCRLVGCKRNIVTGTQPSGGSDGVVRNVMVANCTLTGAETDAVTVLQDTQYVTINGCTIYGYSGAKSINADGYDISITNNNIGDAQVYFADTASATDIIENKRITITGNRLQSDAVANIVNITASDNFDTITISGNEIVGYASTAAAVLVSCGASASVNRLIISGNTCVTGTIHVTVNASATAIANTLIHGNILAKQTGTLQSGIKVTGNFKIGQISICDNQINNEESGVLSKGIEVLDVEKIIINNNLIEGNSTTATGILVDNSATLKSSVTINGNILSEISDASGVGISVVDAQNISIAGNTIAGGSVINGVYVDNNTSTAVCVSISGNNVSGIAAGDANSGIRVDGAATANVNFVSVSGNTVNSAGRCARFDGYINFGTINGNAMQSGTATNSVVYLNGGAASAMNTIAVVGNVISEGVYGIEVANGARCMHDGNAFNSQSTAITTGTFASTADGANVGHYSGP